MSGRGDDDDDDDDDDDVETNRSVAWFLGSRMRRVGGRACVCI